MLINLKNFETWVPLLAGVIIPYLVELLTRYDATGTTKSVVSLILLGLTGLGMYVADTGVSHTWIGAATAMILAASAAAFSRKTITEGTVISPEKWGNAGKLAAFGVGGRGKHSAAA